MLKKRVLLLLLISLKMHTVMAQEKFEITNNWEFRQVNIGQWLPATVPGTVHTDLLDNNIIDNPFYRTNEKDLQWIDKVNWEYQTLFHVEESVFSKNNIEMVFKGLDTYATVYLNGIEILSANNMFRTWQANVKNKLKQGQNKLHIIFHSPIRKGLEAYEKFGLPLPANNDQAENGGLGSNKLSVHTRKAGYHYGWDWGPRFVTSGIWRPIEIKAWDNAKINRVYVYTQRIANNEANLKAEVGLEVSEVNTYTLITKIDGNKVAESTKHLESGTQKISHSLTINNPELWWPVGLGKPHLYTITHELFIGDNLISAKKTKTGVRTAQLVQKEDASKKGRSFYFEINGVPVFAKGANYIPNDLFLPRVTKQDYETLLNSAIDANMNMLRVWGGGIYENDEFYQMCNEKGLMVWQDFMFACSMYPDTPELIENIRQEAIDNIIRLRNHPSIVLWCGNNEIEVAWSEYDHSTGWDGWRKTYSRPDQNKIWAAYETIFHEVLPNEVATHTKNIDYWKSSPSAGPEQVATYNTTSGDIHYWGVWHGLHPISDFNKHVGRFMSEYGFQSFPEFSTVKKYTVPSDWDIESEVMAAHQRSGIGNLRIKQYMEDHYKTPKNFESFLYVSQLLQAKAIKEAIEAHRRQMPYCMGSLFWQLNDCWPVASWSSTDYYRNWKAQQFITKKAYKPLHVLPELTGKKFNVYVVSDKLKSTKAQLSVELVGLEGNVFHAIKENVEVVPNTGHLYLSKSLKKLTKGQERSKCFLVSKIIIDEKVVSENINYFVEPKDLELKKPKIERYTKKEGDKVFLILKTDTLAKDVFITFNGQSVPLSDNYFDLLPLTEKWLELKQPDVDLETLEIKTLFDSYN